MNFTANTKPIVDGLDLGIISSNITKFYQKSCIVELNIEESGLRVNTEAASIKSELMYKGHAEGDGETHVFVDSLLFKNLLRTIESDTVTFELKEDGLTIHSGKSKFNLPQVVSGNDLELSRPQSISQETNSYEIDSSGWEFVKNHQLYSIAMSFIHPVYTNVWLGDKGDVLVGDFDNSIFTHSKKVNLNSTCLVTDTIVNLLTTIPENSHITQIDKNYEIRVETDPYTYVCEFTPKYESDEGVGDYSSSVILDLFKTEDMCITLNVEALSKFIAQAELFMTTNDDTINLTLSQDSFNLINENAKYSVPTTNPFGELECVFKISLLKDAIVHMDKETINMRPLVQEGQVTGILLWTESMETVLAGAE